MTWKDEIKKKRVTAKVFGETKNANKSHVRSLEMYLKFLEKADFDDLEDSIRNAEKELSRYKGMMFKGQVNDVLKLLNQLSVGLKKLENAMDNDYEERKAELEKLLELRGD
jgi:AAA+ ATPase superfamily predicted ATPase